MRHTISLPEELDRRLEEYLRERPGTSLSALVQQVLEERLAPRDLSALLELAGIVPAATTQASERAEDRFARQER